MSTDCFATIESALEFLDLFEEAISDTEAEVGAQLALGDSGRRRDALLLTRHKLDRLGFHIAHSKRMANDLRTLRRLLHDERKLLTSRVPDA